MKSSWAIERESLLAKQRQITAWEGVGERVGRRRHVSGGRGACVRARGGVRAARAAKSVALRTRARGSDVRVSPLLRSLLLCTGA